jgi:high-affinity iron transporter
VEGVLAIAAAISVTSLTVQMWRAAKRIKRDIEGHLHSSTLKTGSAAFTGVFLFTLLMITREGMETALLIGDAGVSNESARPGHWAPSAGLWWRRSSASLWSRYGHRVNLGLFFQVTACSC